MGHDHNDDLDQNLNSGDHKWHKVEGVQVYARRDDQGRPAKVDTIDDDKARIGRIADQLQRAGYGVMRARNPRAGRTFYRLKAIWVGSGNPPENPFTQA